MKKRIPNYLPLILEVKRKYDNPLVFLESNRFYSLLKQDCESLPNDLLVHVKTNFSYSNIFCFNRIHLDTILAKSVKSGNRIAIINLI